MQVTKGGRLHPLLTAAAISLTVFSAVGVATLTGLLPKSFGSQEANQPVATVQAEPAAPVPQPQVVKPVRKHVVHHRIAQATPPAPVVAEVTPPPPLPVASADLGVVQSVREVTEQGNHTALGPVAGGVAGAVLGSQFGHGNGRKVVTVLGALGGALAGREIEEQARATHHWQIEVRHDDGSIETLTSDSAPWAKAGDRVRVVGGQLQPA